MPVWFGGHVISIIEVGWKRVRPIPADDARLLDSVAHYLSVQLVGAFSAMVTLSAAKIYGPKQVGLLWTSDDVRLRPLVLGGGQENGVRSGTENVAGVVGFARAMELAQDCRGEESRRLETLRGRLEEGLSSAFPCAFLFSRTIAYAALSQRRGCYHRRGLIVSAGVVSPPVENRMGFRPRGCAGARVPFHSVPKAPDVA